MIVYRIKIEVSYRDLILEFDTPEEAGNFAKLVLLHNKTKEGKCRISMQVVDTEHEPEEEDEE